jgi:hypothetical protein
MDGMHADPLGWKIVQLPRIERIKGGVGKEIIINCPA